MTERELKAACEKITDVLQECYDVLKQATSLRNLGYNERHAEGGIDESGVTAVEYSNAAKTIERRVSKSRRHVAEVLKSLPTRQTAAALSRKAGDV